MTLEWGSRIRWRAAKERPMVPAPIMATVVVVPIPMMSCFLCLVFLEGGGIE